MKILTPDWICPCHHWSRFRYFYAECDELAVRLRSWFSKDYTLTDWWLTEYLRMDFSFKATSATFWRKERKRGNNDEIIWSDCSIRGFNRNASTLPSYLFSGAPVLFVALQTISMLISGQSQPSTLTPLVSNILSWGRSNWDWNVVVVQLLWQSVCRRGLFVTSNGAWWRHMFPMQHLFLSDCSVNECLWCSLLQANDIWL